MKINGLTPIYFDIETTGFSGFEDEFICAADIINNGEAMIMENIDHVMTRYNSFRGSIIVITYNGENYSGGFDFPWLRSYCIKNDIKWKLSGIKHLDLLPLVRKYLNTTSYQEPCKSDLYADDLKKLAEANGIDYSNKSQAYDDLMEVGDIDWMDYEMQAKEDNSLQNVYQLICDPNCEEEYISGEEIPKLYNKIQEYKSEGKNIIDAEISDLWDEIYNHNRRDVERLKAVAEKVIPVLPDWEIERNINKL